MELTVVRASLKAWPPGAGAEKMEVSIYAISLVNGLTAVLALTTVRPLLPSSLTITYPHAIHQSLSIFAS